MNTNKMKYIFNLKMGLVCALTLLLFKQSTLYAQTPNTGIFFQAIARDQFANPAKDRKIYVQSSIVQSTATGTKVLIEEHQTTTDGSGVFSISVGQGTRTGGTVANLDNVEWAKGPYFLNLKISISPLAPVANWDYTKDWIDLGTSPFGTVPYALYSGSSGALDTKLNITDTVKMLAIYAKAVNVNEIANQVKSKLSVEDTTTMLAPYARMVNELIATNITSLTAETINAALDGKVNLADSITQYVTPTQLNAKTFDSTAIYASLNRKINLADSLTQYVTQAQLKAKTFDSTSIYNQLALRESLSNKSTSVTTDAASDTKFPSVKAVKTYVDTEIAGATIPDANATSKGKIQLAGDLTGTAASPEIAVDAVTTAKIKDANVTDAKIVTVSGSKVVGDIAGNAATASKIATPVTINGVSFDGSANIIIASAAANALTMNASGAGETAGATFDGSAAKTISYNTIGASPLAGSSSLTTVGTITTGVWSATTIDVANGGTGLTSLSAGLIPFGNGTSALGSSNNLVWNNTTGSFGIGTSTPGSGMNTKLDVQGNVSFRNTNAGKALIFDGDAGSNYSRIYTDGNSGTPDDLVLGTYPNGHMNQLFLKQSNGFVGIRKTNPATALDVNGTVTATGFAGPLTGNVTGDVSGALTGNASTATKLAATKNINGVAFDGSADITIAADANTLTGTTLASNVVNSSLTSVGTITSGVWSGTAIENNKLANSSLTIGSTNIELGNTATTIDGLSSVTSNTFAGTLSGTSSAANKLTTGRTITTTGDVTYTSEAFDGTSNVTGTATLTNTTVTAGNYGSTTAIPTFTVDTKGRLTAAGTASIIAEAGTLSGTTLASNVVSSSLTSVGNLNNLTVAGTTSLGGTLSVTGATTLTSLTASGTSTLTTLSAGATTLASANITGATSIGGDLDVTGTTNLNTLNTTSALVSGNITSTGTITANTFVGSFSGTSSATNKLTTGRTIATTGDVTYTSEAFDGTSNVTGTATLTNTTVIAGNYGSTTAIPTFTVDTKGRLTAAGTASIIAESGTLSGTTLASNVVSSSLTSVGTITTGVWSGTAIANNNLANSALTIGTTPISLGATSTTLAGLSTVTSTNFTGALTGNASTATTLATSRNINGVAFNGSSDITVAAAAGTLTGTTLANNVVSSSLTSVGTITTGTWSATTIDVAHGGTGLTSLTPGYIPYGNGIGSFGKTANLFWDNTNSRLGVGTSTPTTKLEVNGSFKAGGIVYPTSDGTEGQYLKTDGSGNIGFTSLIKVPTYSTTNRDAGTFSNGVLIFNSTSGTVQASVPDNSSVVTNSISNSTGNANFGQVSFSSSTQQNVFVQTFTTPSAVNLVSITLNAYVSSSPSTVIVKVFNDADPSDGLTNEVGIISKDITSTSNTNMETFTLPSSYLTSANTTYTFVVYGINSTNTFYLGTYSSDPYSGGTYYTSQANTSYISNSNLSSIGLTNYSTNDLKFNVNYATGASASKWIDFLNMVDLTSNVTGILPLTNGGTGAITASGARSNLGLAALATKSTIANADVASGAAIEFAKLNITKADITGLGVQEELTAGSGISISAGTISATGLTTSNLSSTAGITNSQLANSNTTLGSTIMTLGGTVTSVTGLTSVTSNGFTGALTGNASTATTLATSRNINGVAFNGSSDITVAAAAGTLSGTTLASNVVSSSLTSVGTITTGVWSGTAIANNNLANSALTIGTTPISLGATSTTLAGLSTVTSTNFTGALTGNASTATTLATSRNINGVAFNGSSDITVAAAAGTLTGTTLASNVVSSSLTSVGTITSGVWSGTAVAVANGGTGVTTSTGTGSLVLSNTPTLVTPILGAATGTSLSLTGNLTASAGTFSSTLSAGATNLGTLTTTGSATISNTTNSTSFSTGALIVRGGVGIANNLTVGGTIEIDGGSPGAGKVLTSDATGLASWTNAVGSTVLTSTSNYTITLAEAYIFYNGTVAGTFSIPAAVAGNAGKAITIKNKTAFGITITPLSSGTIYIDNANTQATSVSIGIEASNNWIKLVSDGTQWNVIRALF